jgi:hypothetical protein
MVSVGRFVASLRSLPAASFRRFGRTKPAVADRLAGYVTRAKSKRARLLGRLFLLLISLLYGLVVGASGTIFLTQMLVPLALAALLLIWLLPVTEDPPVRVIELLFFLYLAMSMTWPDYLAIALPGLPWITMARLFAFPLAIFYMLALSQAIGFRTAVKDALIGVPLTWKAMLAFVVCGAISVVFSDRPLDSANRFIVLLYAWALIFFVAISVFLKEGFATRFCFLVWICALVICLIALFEVKRQALPWAGHIPSFLKVQDEAVQRMLAPKIRGSTGVFRAQTKFATPLSMAEFLALSFPFVLHLASYHGRVVIRVLAILSIPVIIWAILQTDARLGTVGCFFTTLLFGLAWALRRAKERPQSLFSPVVLLGYPVGFVAFILASFTVGRLRNAVWGSSAYADSNQARVEQLSMGLPMIAERPWGYGIGRAGEKLGFTNSQGEGTIDNYLLTVALDLGLIGIAAFILTFTATIFVAAREAPRAYDFETSLLVPAAICLINFLMIKVVLSQMENHTIFFAVLGLAVALIYRVQRKHPS